MSEDFLIENNRLAAKTLFLADCRINATFTRLGPPANAVSSLFAEGKMSAQRHGQPLSEPVPLRQQPFSLGA
jgi:hypothetical protein